VPRFWIVAGPNGSGKSTLVDSGAVNHLLGTDLVYLNADVRTRQILDADPEASNAKLTAAIEIDARVASCIDHGTDFVVETVLSSDKYLNDIAAVLILAAERPRSSCSGLTRASPTSHPWLIFHNIFVLGVATDARVKPEHDGERAMTGQNENC